MKLLVLLSVFVLFGAATSQSCTQGTTFSSVSGTINNPTSITTPTKVCTYYLVPPSPEYTYVTINTTFDYVQYGESIHIYDGNTDLLAVYENVWTAVPMITTVKPDIMISYVTQGYAYTTWSISYEFHTGNPPPCAGPRWMNLPSGSTEYFSLSVVGTSSQTAKCSWIMGQVEAPSGCNYKLTYQLLSFEDSTDSGVVTIYRTQPLRIDGSITASSKPDSKFTVEGYYLESMYVELDVTTFPSSETNLLMSVSYDGTCDSYKPEDVQHSGLGVIAYLMIVVPVVVIGGIALCIFACFYRRYKQVRNCYGNRVTLQDKAEQRICLQAMQPAVAPGAYVMPIFTQLPSDDS